jgi:hypothetical protein
MAEQITAASIVEKILNDAHAANRPAPVQNPLTIKDYYINRLLQKTIDLDTKNMLVIGGKEVKFNNGQRDQLVVEIESEIIRCRENRPNARFNDKFSAVLQANLEEGNSAKLKENFKIIFEGLEDPKHHPIEPKLIPSYVMILKISLNEAVIDKATSMKIENVAENVAKKPVEVENTVAVDPNSKALVPAP